MLPDQYMQCAMFQIFSSIKTATFGMSINTIQDVSFEGCSKMEGDKKGFPPLNLSRIFCNDETWHGIILPKKNTKNIWIS